jgi:hypothetical protein
MDRDYVNHAYMTRASRLRSQWPAGVWVTAVILASAMLAGCAGSVSTKSPPGFTVTGSMTVGRVGHGAALLGNGRVLIAGGYTGNLTYLASAELYDPAAGTFGPTGSMAAARAGATTTLLSNGKVLVAGGYIIDGAAATVPLATAEVYDPASGTFSATGSMANARYNHTATLLADGRVLVTGGAGDDVALASAELYDPATGRFASAGSMTTARIGHAAALLTGGRVLLMGGTDSLGPAKPIYLASAETYDPAAGTFAAAGSMATVRYGHTATALGDGRVIICGGLRNDSGQKSSLATCERYDPQSRAFEPAGAMSAARSGQVAVLLADGRVLIAGGQNVESQTQFSYPMSADLYDPAAGGFSSAGSMHEGRMSPTATRLGDGRILIAGGANSTTITSSAELYQP